jgi:hypothetical protein
MVISSNTNGQVFAQDDVRMRINVMYLAANRTGHRPIGVAIFRGVLGNKALNTISGLGAAVQEQRHLDPQGKGERRPAPTIRPTSSQVPM